MNSSLVCRLLPTLASAGMGRAFRRVCLSVCLSVCPCSNRFLAWAINTRLGTCILYSSCSAFIDPEVKRSRSHGYENRHSHTVASDRDRCCVIQ